MFTVLPLASLALFLVLPIPVAAPLCIGIIGAAWYARWAIHRSVRFLPPLTGVESMAGRTAVVVAPLHPTGTIRYQGEVWRAASQMPLDEGAQVRIVRVERFPEGLTAVVEAPDRQSS